VKVAGLFLCVLSFAILTRAQAVEPARKQESPGAARSTHDIVPLPSIKSLTSEQAAGKKLFVQRCSVCHLPALPSYTAYGPLLDRSVVVDRGDDAIRQQIVQGSARMPGYQYTLSPAEIDAIVNYLKTLDLLKKE
jgi:mono/diheme cytochrome c family protein